MRYFILFFALGAAMLTWVILRTPSPETFGLCFLAWFGGIAFTLLMQFLLRKRRVQW